MDYEAEVVAIDLAHGEAWTFFPDDGVYAITKRTDLATLQRAVAEMSVHARMMRSSIPA